VKDLIPLSALTAVNPCFEQFKITVPPPLPSINDFLSFIPMGDVSDSGKWIAKQQRRLKDIGPGCSPSQQDDVRLLYFLKSFKLPKHMSTSPRRLKLAHDRTNN
jgi:hypothetical protein